MIAIKTCLGIVVLASFGAGCSPLVGFKDVTVVDAKAGDDAADAPVDAKPDAMIDAGPPPKLWVFVTDSGTTGGFGAGAPGARETADIKCQDMYNASFTARGCTITDVHAVIQIDDVDDSLARMEIKFPIPQMSEVLRATDATSVAQNWDALVNPNAVLSAPISTGTAAVRFWSGRGENASVQCTNWTSASAGVMGDTGDATKVNKWTSQGTRTCNDFSVHLLCICW